MLHMSDTSRSVSSPYSSIQSAALCDIEECFDSADLLEEIEMPEYITEDYNGAEW